MGKKNSSKKEEKRLEKYMTTGCMLGMTIGSILSIIKNNMLFLVIGASVGSLLGILFSSDITIKRKK